jgi:hypothetical protein
MQLSPSWKGDTCSAITTIHCRFHKIQSLVPILCQINQVHILQLHLREILILSSHLQLRLPNGLFPSDFPTETVY